jgi:oxygen-independent coproporphyrinogen-3 oxidase
VLPQHLHLYDGVYDELKLAGRVTLRDPQKYLAVLEAYLHRTPLAPSEIGGGPASVLEPVNISEDFFAQTLQCGHQCHRCTICQEYWQTNVHYQAPQDVMQPHILAAAAQSIPHETIQAEKTASCQFLQDSPLLPYLQDVPETIDVNAILTQWEAVQHVYPLEDRKMPSPIWVERGFEHNGSEAWDHVGQVIPQTSTDSAMAIYIHVPFCNRRCGFCDCYSLPLGKRQRQEKEQQYTQTVLAEMEAWSRIAPLAQRPVSTVHFGGGTPNCLQLEALLRITEQCRQCFHVTPETEWALESTSSLLTEDHLHQLQNLVFTRLHVGVQTLDNSLRQKIGRQESPDIVLQRIVRCLEMGFITTVDVIYGLPGQRIDGLLETLAYLRDVGIHGVSLYRLNVSNRNQKFLAKQSGFSRDSLRDYVLFHVADQFLIQAGYRKNHFAHFARPEDQNLYYNHVKRGEDLLALGPTADGVFGEYHYRHPEYTPYVSGLHPGIPVLEGGICETSSDRTLRPLIAALMTANIPEGLSRELQCEAVLQKWLRTALLRQSHNAGSFTLTANGSWLINEMIADLTHFKKSLESLYS